MLKHQSQPNRWSCSVAAAAMAMHVPVAELIDKIGHDGSEIKCDLPEPLCRAGFAPQEIIDVAFEYGWSITEIEPNPQMTPNGEVIWSVFDSEDKIRARMESYMDNFSGTVFGPRYDQKNWHYVAWCHRSQCWLDPSGPTLKKDCPPIQVYSFQIYQKTDRYLAASFLEQLRNKGRR